MLRGLVTLGDIQEAVRELKRQGLARVANRLRLDGRKATEATWNRADVPAKNIDAVEAIGRHTALVATGSPDGDIVSYVTRTHLSNRGPLNALSIGSGHGTIEMEWAKAGSYSSLTGIDMAGDAVANANTAAQRQGLENLAFKVGDANRGSLGDEEYDVVFAWHSLHHLSPIRDAVKRIHRALKHGGLLVLFEYVGPSRFQWSSRQLEEANALLRTIPTHLRKRYGLSSCKRRIHRPGLLRMRLADPSEAAESDRIVPEVEECFTTVEKKDLPGTLLQLIFHDIGHNFRTDDPEANASVSRCIAREEELVSSGDLHSNFILGVFSKP